MRGASGDVRSVWNAFASQFRWVAGVAGNHDTFGTSRERERFLQQPGLYLMDGEVHEVDGLRLGGVSGIIGRTDKPGRRAEADQLKRIQGVLRQEPEVLVLHEGPDFPPGDLRDNSAIREAVEAREELLVVCVLNVDARAVLLVKA
ncbi:hypothetical protein DB31_8570 [Hyalangium minutum]|uniref:Calcineurin-like phosphoesterase domain-containing protein n=2 Tax=Hyalangium minutum TaxID=394096 RepID=A0A085WHQ4_9BACT|nr:hypothetical protein DB31_8570 [Hyalangium minutum]